MAPGDCKDPVCWEIINRFRLFADQTDFQPHVDAWLATKSDGHSVLAMENWLSSRPEFEKLGWASSVFSRKSGRGVCFDEQSNQVKKICVRDGAKEAYLDPATFLIRLHVRTPPGFNQATCKWTADPGFFDRSGNLQPPPDDCKDASGKDIEVRVRKGATKISVTMQKADNTTWSHQFTVDPKVATVVGMGDSFTSGDGNPDVPVRLESVGATGMCFKRIVTGEQFYLPSRWMPQSQDCALGGPDPAGGQNVDPGYGSPVTINDKNFVAARARWLYAPCHRSLYGHQLRAALTLAVEDVHRAIAYIPLGCTGAEIKKGLLNAQQARERTLREMSLKHGPDVVPQVANLRAQLGKTKPDVLLLTVGGNDIGFPQLAANIFVGPGKERDALTSSGNLFGPDRAKAKLKALRSDFSALRTALRPILGGDLSKVVYTPYGNPLTHSDSKTLCGDTRRGYDAHPAFTFSGARAQITSRFVEEDFIPTLKALATCEKDKDCVDPDKERMKWADSHRDAFAIHGICARFGNAGGIAEPSFDEACFDNGNTFRKYGEGDGLKNPFRKCGHTPSAWRSYAKRARWMRTPNDSYLTAMTYADSLPKILHSLYASDAIWGVSSVVYGGAAHPTAEGHAAMADADLVEARKILAGK